MCEYLDQQSDLIKEKTVIELGAGTGLLGIVASLLGQFCAFYRKQFINMFVCHRIYLNAQTEQL